MDFRRGEPVHKLKNRRTMMDAYMLAVLIPIGVALWFQRRAQSKLWRAYERSRRIRDDAMARLQVELEALENTHGKN